MAKSKKTRMSNLWHVVPEGDLRSHRLSVNCWCSPEHDPEDPEDGFMVYHQSLDERELYQDGEKAVH